MTDSQLLGWRQNVLLKCLLTSSSQLCLISFSAHSSLSAPLWFCHTTFCPRTSPHALSYSHSHLQAYFRSSIYQILPWISHRGLQCTEHLFCSPCPVDWLTDWLICGIKILSFLLPKDESHVCFWLSLYFQSTTTWLGQRIYFFLNYVCTPF